LTTLTTKKICLDARVHCAVLKVRAVHLRDSSCAVTSTVMRGRTCPGRRELTATHEEAPNSTDRRSDTGKHPSATDVVRRCSTGPEPSGPNSVSDVVATLEVPHDRQAGRSTTRERVRHPLSDVPPMSNLGGTYAHSKGSGRHYRNSPISDARCSLERR